MSLINRLIVLNLLDLSYTIPALPAEQREAMLDIALGEIQDALGEADEQLIALKSRHAQDENNLVGVLRSIQELHKTELSGDKASQLTALQEARGRLEEDLSGLEFEERQLRQEVARLMAKVNAADVQRAEWLAKNNPSPNSEPPSPPPTEKPNSTNIPHFGYSRIDEPFERLERLKRQLAAAEISQQEATQLLEQEMRDFELEKLFQTQEQEEQLARELAELKKKLI